MAECTCGGGLTYWHYEGCALLDRPSPEQTGGGE